MKTKLTGLMVLCFVMVVTSSVFADDAKYYGGSYDGYGSATSAPDIPLPVTLTSFTATDSSGLVVLRWTVQNEVNNARFDLLRSQSQDGEYVHIAQIPGRGTATSSYQYRYIDRNVSTGRSYWYQLATVSYEGTRTMYGPISVTVQPEAKALPAEFGLSQNFPNPFNPVTEICYQLPKDSYIVLTVYDVLGQEVQVLVDGLVKAGYRSAVWDAKDAASGIYFIQMQTGNFVERRKMALIR
jgi:hypothetical protein